MQRQRFPGRIELLLADGGSTDGTRDILDALARKDPRIHILENPRQSVTSGLNVALRHAQGKWVARMDAHTEYPEDYVLLGVQRLERGGTRWVSGPQIPSGQGRVSRAIALALASRLGRGGSRKWGAFDAAGEEEYDLDAGVFAGVWARATLAECGGWDERWRLNEDSELAGRFLARGERLVCLPAMGARYSPRESLRGLWRQYLAYGEYRMKTAVRHPHTMRRSHLLAPAMVLDLMLAACGPRSVRRVARVGVWAYAGALAATTLRALPKAQRRADALAVPAVLVAMHFAHGTGALIGALRYGPPLASLASMAGLSRLAASLAPAEEPVFAPSLS
jgi:succinoglycan biosynthesis protein ExoA